MSDRGIATARLAMAGLVLAALALPIAPSSTQVATSERELVERIQALRREVESDAQSQTQAQAGAVARPTLSEEDVRSLMRTNLGVEVLAVDLVESEGQPAYAVTVMHPPGNDNSAFQVEILLVGGATGGMLGRVPQRPRVARDLAESSGQVDFESNGLEIRRRSHR